MPESRALFEPPPPIPVGSGRVFNFTPPGLEVVTKKFFSSKKFFIMWDTIAKVDVEWGCFQGTLTVVVSTGQRYPFTCRKSAIMQAASSIYKHSSTRSTGQKRTVSDEVMKKLGPHPEVAITDDGLMVKRRLGWWTSAFTFVPWSSIVSVSLSPDRRLVTVNTTLEVEGPEALDGDPEGARRSAATSSVSESALSDDSHETEEHELEVVRIHGRPDATEAVYEEIISMMCDGLGREPLVPEIIARHNVSATMSQAGLVVTHKSGCFGGLARSFVPWTSMAQLAFHAKTTCGRHSVEVMDRSGASVILDRTQLQDFHAIREMFSRMACEIVDLGHGGGGEGLPLAKGLAKATSSLPKALAAAGGCARSSGEKEESGLKMREDGLHLFSDGRFGSRRVFLPWSRVDGLQLTLGLFGGRASLLAETGDELEVARTGLFAGNGLWELYDEVMLHKYGVDPGCGNVVTFNHARNDRLSCELSDHNLKLVIGQKVREWDLARVIGCSSAPTFRSGKGIIVQLSISDSGRRQEIRLPVARRNDAGQLAADIVRRASVRRRMLSEPRLVA